MFSIKIRFCFVFFLFPPWGFHLNLQLEMDEFTDLLTIQKSEHLLLWNTHHVREALARWKSLLYCRWQRVMWVWAKWGWYPNLGCYLVLNFNTVTIKIYKTGKIILNTINKCILSDLILLLLDTYRHTQKNSLKRRKKATTPQR